MAAVLDVMDGPLIWGASDCCASACDVFKALHGIDPMAPLRGTYDSEEGAEKVIRSWGGWQRMTARLAALAGLSDGVGAAGEIGLMRLPDRFVLSISIGWGQWAGRVDGGFQSWDAVIRSWGAPHA